MSKIKKGKKPKYALYVCGIPTCRTKVAIPDQGEMAKYPHRDKHGFRCNGLLVRFDQTDEGKAYKRDRLFAKIQKPKRPG